jgi:TRAP-type C4-dicarboxylate transport system permease small subunit
LKKFATIVDWIERGFLVALFAVLVGLTSTQIVLRNLFDSGLVWADDAIKVLVLWIAMSGALYATRGANHISIDVASRFLPKTISGLVKRFLFVIATAICAVASWYSYQFVLLEFEDPIIAFLNIPTWLTQAVIPIILLLMALRFLSLIIWLPKPVASHPADKQTDEGMAS